MKRTVIVLCLVLCAAVNSSFGEAARKSDLDLKYRYVYIQRNFTTERHVTEVKRIVQRASITGYNGIIVSGSFSRIALRDDDYIDRLKQVKAICDQYGMDLVPLLFSAGYGGGVLAHNPNLAAAVPARNVPFTVKGGTAMLVKNTGIGFTNGGFERHSDNSADGYQLQDLPGKLSFIDESVSKSGKSSLRVENVGKKNDGKGRIMQQMAVFPFRSYQVSMWVKTEGLNPAKRFQVSVMTKEGRVLMTILPSLESTQDWKKVTLGFNSLEYDELRIWAGVWNGPKGRFWIDDMRISEVGFINVLHRPGTPMIVKNRETGAVYTEGKDYASVKDEKLTYRFDHREPLLTVSPGSAIKNGDELVVDYYQGLALKHGGGQMGVCMSEPQVYDIWRDAVRRLDAAISPKHYLLSMDEIRHGGWCKACEDRGLSAGELIGSCITRQVELIREVNPAAEMFVWSDMLDPNLNAKKDYYLLKGDASGSWNHVPKDLIVAVWKFGIRDESLAHFDRNGFRTIGCGYYDVESSGNAKAWMKSLANTPEACGIMYTTWNNKYDYLEDFAKITIDQYKK